MEPQAPGLDDRLAGLEAQIDRLNAALQQWRHSQNRLDPLEHRLAELTDQCATILKQWSATGERHAHAVGELEARLTNWGDVEARLQREASTRFEALEHAIEQEWAALRRLHEEPVQLLRTQAENLTEICVSTAGSAQTGLERAEARLAALEHDLHQRMDDLSRDLHAAVAELRPRSGSALGGSSTPWSLDEVTRLHNDIREGASRPDAVALAAPVPIAALPAAVAGSASEVVDVAPAAAAALSVAPDRGLVESLNSVGARMASPIGSSDETPGATARADAARVETAIVRALSVPSISSPPPLDTSLPAPTTSDGRWYAAVSALALSLGIAVVFALSLYKRADTAAAQASAAQQHAEQIATAADERIEAARQDAATRIAQARETASKAQVTSEVLAAPDLIRFNLAGGDPGARFSAQLLVSRSRGIVFSGSRLPAPPAGSTYQIWLVTPAGLVSAGTFVPDATGRGTFTSDTLPDVPRPIADARVTLEPEPGRGAPSGSIVLARGQ